MKMKMDDDKEMVFDNLDEWIDDNKIVRCYYIFRVVYGNDGDYVL